MFLFVKVKPDRNFDHIRFCLVSVEVILDSSVYLVLFSVT